MPSSSDLLEAGWEALIEAGFRTGDFTAARALLDSANTQALAAGDPAAQESVLDGLGMLAHYSNVALLMNGETVADGAADAEETLFRDALERHQQVGDVVGSALSLFGIGLVQQALRRDWESALPYFRQAIDRGARAQCGLYTRSEVHRHVGFYYLVEAAEPEIAMRHLQTSLDLREQLGDARRIPSGLTALAEAELATGNRDRAVALLRRAVADARAAGLAQARVEDAERTLRKAQAGT